MGIRKGHTEMDGPTVAISTVLFRIEFFLKKGETKKKHTKKLKKIDTKAKCTHSLKKHPALVTNYKNSPDKDEGGHVETETCFHQLCGTCIFFIVVCVGPEPTL